MVEVRGMSKDEMNGKSYEGSKVLITLGPKLRIERDSFPVLFCEDIVVTPFSFCMQLSSPVFP